MGLPPDATSVTVLAITDQLSGAALYVAPQRRLRALAASDNSAASTVRVDFSVALSSPSAASSAATLQAALLSADGASAAAFANAVVTALPGAPAGLTAVQAAAHTGATGVGAGGGTAAPALTVGAMAAIATAAAVLAASALVGAARLRRAWRARSEREAAGMGAVNPLGAAIASKLKFAAASAAASTADVRVVLKRKPGTPRYVAPSPEASPRACDRPPSPRAVARLVVPARSPSTSLRGENLNAAIAGLVLRSVTAAAATAPAPAAPPVKVVADVSKEEVLC